MAQCDKRGLNDMALSKIKGYINWAGETPKALKMHLNTFDKVTDERTGQMTYLLVML